MKTPERRQATSGVVGQQQTLFDPPKLSASGPKPATLADKAFWLLLTGDSITSPDFQSRTYSWRLAAYVRELKRLGWPIESVGVPFATNPSRTIAMYWLPQCVIDGVNGGNHA